MYFFKYLKFLLSATNQHGVHSPFVYRLITKCLYTKEKYSNHKSLNVVLKIIAYFQISELALKDENKALTELIELHFPKTTITKNTSDFIYCNNINHTLIPYIADENAIPHKSIVFIDELYKNKKAWEALILMEKITVSIDLFYCGVLFFRREQVKEHFKIRI